MVLFVPNVHKKFEFYRHYYIQYISQLFVMVTNAFMVSFAYIETLASIMTIVLYKVLISYLNPCYCSLEG